MAWGIRPNREKEKKIPLKTSQIPFCPIPSSSTLTNICGARKGNAPLNRALSETAARQ